MKSSLSGVFAATLTPYDPGGSVSYDTAGKLASFLFKSGISGVCPAGTTGEFPMLTRDEKAGLNAVSAAAGTVIAGTWGTREDERAYLAKRAAQDGARAVFLTTPIFFKAAPEAILSWYRGVRASTSLPVFAYSIPQHTGNPIPLDVLERLADEGTINGFKDSSGDFKWMEQVVSRLKGRITIFAGHEAIFAESRNIGVDGFISGIAGVFPGAVLAAWNGDTGSVERLMKIRSALHEAGTIPGLKYLSMKLGFDCGNPREPLLPASGRARETLDALLRDTGTA